MANILGGLYSLGNRAKRQARDLVSDPVGYAQQSLDEIGRRLLDDPVTVATDAWNATPLGVGAGVVKKVAVDPLAEAIARRMTAQLEAIPQVGGLEALKGVNLPAAYAGDQRSLKAAQRAINKAETGLESPGRRKMLKQTAATAARQMVPGPVDVALGAIARNAAKEAMTSPVIPDESVQAAIAAAVRDTIQKRMPELHNKYYEEGADIVGLVPELSPAAIAKKFSLPESSVAGYISKSGVTPAGYVERMVHSGHDTALEDFWNYPIYDKLEYFNIPKYGLDPALSDDDLVEAFIKAAKEDEVSPYARLFGDKYFKEIDMMPHEGYAGHSGIASSKLDAILESDEDLATILREIISEQSVE